MNKKVLILKFSIIIILLNFKGFTQNRDTIYFAKNYELTNSNSFKYYRVFVKLDSMIRIVDYSKKGNILMRGQCKTSVERVKQGIIENETGCFIEYNRKGKVIHTSIYDAINYKSLIDKYYEFKDFNSSVKEDLVFKINYDRKGNIKSKGFMIDDCSSDTCSCLWHLNWVFYGNTLTTINNYSYGELVRQKLYSHGKEWISREYKDDKKDGEFKEYYWNGNKNILIKEGNYLNGKKHGEFNYYSREDGSLERVVIFDNGKRIK